MAETFTEKLKLSKRDTGDLNWGQGANANLEALDAHIQQACLRPPRTILATLGSGGAGANLSGGTAYFYKVTALNAAGETTEGKIPAIVEAQITQPATPLPVILQWEPVKGASGYRIYKSTASGQQKLLASVSGEATVTYTDDGNTAVDPGISVPAENTAYTSVSKIIAGNNISITPTNGTGEVTINAAGAAGPPDASDAVKGITKLSVAPAVADSPIAVGDNDPRNSDARTPTGAASGDLSGNFPGPTVAKLQAYPISPTAPADGQVLKYSSSNAQWEPGTPAAGGGYVKVVVAAPSGVAATDQSNIQTALNSIGTEGGLVLLREGIYQLTGALTVKLKTRIQGQGMDVTVLKAPNLALNASLFVSSTYPNPSYSIEFLDVGFDWTSVQGEDTALLSGTGGGTNTIDHVKILRCRFKGHSYTLRLHMTRLANGSAYGWEIAHCVFDGNQRTQFNFMSTASVGMVFKSNVHHNTFKNSYTEGIFVQVRTHDTIFANNIIHSQAAAALLVERSDSSASSLDSIVGSNMIYTGAGQMALYIRGPNGSFVGNKLIGGGKILLEANGTNNLVEANHGDIELSSGVYGNSVIGNKGTVTDNSGAANTVVSTFVSGVRKLGEASPLAGDVKLEAGTNITLTQDAVNNKISIAAGGGGAWVKVYEEVLASTASQFSAVTGLDLDTHKLYRFILSIRDKSGTAGDLEAQLIMNNLTTLTNYQSRRRIYGNDGTITLNAAEAAPVITKLDDHAFIEGYIHNQSGNDYTCLIARAHKGVPWYCSMEDIMLTTYNIVGVNLTQIQVKSHDITKYFGAGSWLRILRPA